MKLFESLLKLLRSLFGGRKGPSKVLPPEPAEEPEETREPEPPDAPEEDFDDPDYDVEHVTDDDDTEREPLKEHEKPEPDEIAEAEAKMPPLDTWKQRQQALTDLGYELGPIDGIPGRKTSAAVRAFEEDHGLPGDGEWDRDLQRAVEKALAEKADSKIDPMPIPPPPGAGYDNMIDESEYGLDDAFWSCFIDLTSKSNVKDGKGRRRRKGVRKFVRLVRFCWHQTAFVWRPYRVSKELGKYTGHHKINAHALFDTDGTILLLHNFKFYLWTANAFNPDCISIEVMGNFEGVQGSGRWYKGDKFGRARPTREQLIRCRQFTLWLLDPEQGPPDEELPKPLLEWRQGCREHGNPLKWDNTHRESSGNRQADCGSELWYHVVEWAFASTKLVQGPRKGKGMAIPSSWRAKPPAPPVPPAGSVDA